MRRLRARSVENAAEGRGAGAIWRRDERWEKAATIRAMCDGAAASPAFKRKKKKKSKFKVASALKRSERQVLKSNRF